MNKSLVNALYVLLVLNACALPYMLAEIFDVRLFSTREAESASQIVHIQDNDRVYMPELSDKLEVITAIKNESRDHAVTVKSITKSCLCQDVEISSKEILPLQTVYLKSGIDISHSHVFGEYVVVITFSAEGVDFEKAVRMYVYSHCAIGREVSPVHYIDPRLPYVLNIPVRGITTITGQVPTVSCTSNAIAVSSTKDTITVRYTPGIDDVIDRVVYVKIDVNNFKYDFQFNFMNMRNALPASRYN